MASTTAPTEAAAFWGLAPDAAAATIPAGDIELTDAQEPESVAEGVGVGVPSDAAEVHEVAMEGEAPNDCAAESHPSALAEAAEPGDAVAVNDALGGQPFPMDPPAAVYDEPQQPVLEEVAVEPFVEEDEEPAPMAAEPAEVIEDAPRPIEAVLPETNQPPESSSFIDRYRHLLPDDDEATSAEPVVAPAPIETPFVDEGETAAEDDSIDDYMQKMMERIRGGTAAPEPSAPALPKAVAPPPTSVAAPAPPAAPIEAEQVKLASSEAPLSSLDELKPSPRAVSAVDMDQMRMLANQSARQAIDVANVRQTREKITLTLVVSGAVFCCGALAAITAPSALGKQFLLGLLALAGSGWYFVRTLRGAETNARLAKELTAAEPNE